MRSLKPGPTAERDGRYPLRLDPGDAADIVWATNAAELYQLLVGQRGWSPQRYERFLADAWRRLLLPG